MIVKMPTDSSISYASLSSMPSEVGMFSRASLNSATASFALPANFRRARARVSRSVLSRVGRTPESDHDFDRLIGSLGLPVRLGMVCCGIEQADLKGFENRLPESGGGDICLEK